MNEELAKFDENELSEEDLAVLRAFETMEDWSETLASDPSSSQNTIRETAEYSSEDMHLIFVTEVDEDVTRMRRLLNQLEQESRIQPERFETFRRLGHKIRGSAGAIEYSIIAKIAQHIEEISEQIIQGTIFPLIGVNALTYAVSAIEVALQNVVTTDNEYSTPLSELEEELKNLLADRAFEETTEDQSPSRKEKDVSATSNVSIDATASSTHVDVRRLEHLLHHSEQLAELRIPMESAQRQLNSAIRELHAAQARFVQLEPALFDLLTSGALSLPVNEPPTSSLMARILSNAGQRNDSAHSRHSRRHRSLSRLSQASEVAMGDELEIERYTEQDLLLNSLREAIYEVSAASSHVDIAFERLRLLTQEYSTQAALVRNGTLLLRLVPLRILVPRLQDAIIAAAQGQYVQFEVVGDAIEIDQQTLNALSTPLLHLLETCSIDTSLAHTTVQEPFRVWLHAQESGNEIAIEVGFSVAVNGGAVEPLREVVQRLNGRLSLQRNSAGGVSFHLYLPRSQGTTHCLLLRVNDQHVIVPFSQVQRIGDGKREHFNKLYSLRDLLGCPIKPVSPDRIEPVLVLLQGSSPVTVAIVVDEVVDDVELVVRALPSYLQRPGITSASVNGQGRVLLLADLPELVRHFTYTQHNKGKENPPAADLTQSLRQSPPKVLLADDSVYLRQTLVHMLKHVNYTILEARDGLEALEQLIQQTPDIFLLDVEMPNLNGYDLLDIMRLYPSLAGVKIIMLTSRSSEKHMQHALDLGAHAYLTKPCSQETLIETIQKLLRS